jgi:hypothetical protein
LSGAATRITVDKKGSPWVINKDDSIYYMKNVNEDKWEKLGGSAK